MKKSILLLCVLCAFTVSSYAQIDSTIVDSTLTQLSELPDTAKLGKDEVIYIVEKVVDYSIEQAKNSPDSKNPMEWIGWGVAALLGLIALISEMFYKKKKE
jgi:hypothetical protein